jgi:hypothetical protein
VSILSRINILSSSSNGEVGAKGLFPLFIPSVQALITLVFKGLLFPTEFIF